MEQIVKVWKFNRSWRLYLKQADVVDGTANTMYTMIDKVIDHQIIPLSIAVYIALL